MSFLHASLLLGGLLIAVPIALHLIMRRKPRLVVFPALQFVRQKRDANRRRMRLRHLLLLILRCAAIGLLALALARPSLTGSGVLGEEGAPIATVLVIDNGLRMEYRHENATRLTDARQLADRLLAQLPEETPVAVSDLSGGRVAFAVDLGAARQQVARLTPTAASRRLSETVGDAIRLLQEKPDHRKELFVFTDLAAVAWTDKDLRSIAGHLDTAGDVAMYVIDVGVEEAQNFGLGRIHLEDRVLVPNVPVKLRVPLVRAGPNTERPIELTLQRPGGKPERRDHRIETWSADSPAQIELTLSNLDYGTHQGVVHIVGEDALAGDDARYFTIRVQPPRHVLLAGLTERETTFVQEALSTSGRFECRFEAFDRLANIEMDSFSAAFLLDPPPLPSAVWQRLYEFAKNGSGLVICLGHRARRDVFDTNDPQQLLAGPLMRQSRAGTYLSPTDYDHPVLAKFRPYAGQVPWQQFPVDKYWELKDLAPGATVVLGYADGRPALIERSVGAGRVLTMTTPLSDPPYLYRREVWNYLPMGLSTEPWPSWLLMTELAAYLTGDDDDRTNYLAGETAVLHLAPEERREVHEAGGFAVLLPTGEGLRRSLAPGANTVALSATRSVGNYLVTAGGQAGALKRGFSVNADPAISQLARTTNDQIAAALGEKRVRFACNADEIEIRVGLGRVGHELFPSLIGLVAVALAGELVLANRFYREGK